MEAAAAAAAVAPTADALRRALEVAAKYAVDQRSFDAIDRELRRTEQRLRAIERRRLPMLEGALQALELGLDELEREERVIGRWAHDRRQADQGSVRAALGPVPPRPPFPPEPAPIPPEPVPPPEPIPPPEPLPVPPTPASQR